MTIITTREKIEKILTREFSPLYLEVTDDSLSHARHPEARASGRGHYSVVIVSPAFQGKSSLARHREIYRALRKELKGEIHALAIKAYFPKEKERPPHCD